MSGIHFPITGDNSSFLRSLQGCEKGVSETAKKIQESGTSIEGMFSRLTKAAAAFGAGFTATEFVRQVAAIRGEFQQLEVAFETMLGSKEKSNALMAQLTKTAAITPFGLQDVASGAKQLLAYGTAADEVNDTLVRLGDIAAGLSIPLNDLVYLYGTTMTQGRMFTQDLRQFQGRGVPIAEEIAKIFGTTKDKVGELVTAGRVGADEFRQAILNMTNAGGKFGGLMEAQSKTITGQLSNIQDAIDVMFNNIGKSSEGAINATLEAVSSLVQNYEKVGEAVGVAVTAYGAYKAALMVGIAVQKAEAAITSEAALQKQSAAMAGHTLSAAQARATATSILFANAQRTVAASLKAVAAATIANPYVLAAAAITGVVYGVYKLATADTAAEAAAKRYNKAIEEQARLENKRKEALEGYLEVLGDEYASSTAKVRAMNAIREQYPALIQKYIDEKGHIKDLAGLWKEYNEEVERNRILQNKQALTEANKAVEEKKLRLTNVGSMYNPEGQNKAKREYEEAVELQKIAQQKVDDDNFIEWQKNLKKRTEEQIAAELTELKRIQSARKNNAFYKQNAVGVGGYTGIVSDSELTKSIEALEAEQSLRNQVTSKYSEDYKKAQDDWIKAKKLLADIEKDKSKFTTKQYEDAKSNEKLTKEVYEKLGGDTSEKQLKAEKERIKKIGELSNELIEIRRDNTQNEVDIMKEGTDKKIAQINADFKAQEQAIQKRAKELATANKEAGIGNLNSKGLTHEQQAEINKALMLNVEAMDKSLNELYETPIKEYQSYTDKRLEIEKKFNEDILLLREALNRAMQEGDEDKIAQINRSIAEATAQKGRSLMTHDLDVLKESPDYIRAFEDLGNTSTETLNALVVEFEKVKKAASESLNPKDLREYTSTIQALMDELESRNPFKAVSDAQKLVIETNKGVAEAKERLEKVQKGEKVLKTTRYDEKTKQIVLVYWEAAEATEAYRKAQDDNTKATNKLMKAEKAQKEEIDQLISAIRQVGSSIGGTAGEIVNLVGDIASFTNSCIEGVLMMSKAASDSISAVEKASVILGIVSAAVQILQKISSLGENNQFKEYEKAAEKADEIYTLTKAVNDYELAILRANNAEKTWFSQSGIQQLKSYRQEHEKLNEAYKLATERDQAKYQNKSGGGWLTGAANWIMANMSILSPFEGWRNIWGQGSYNKGMVDAIDNLRIETRKASSGFLGTGIGGKSQKTKDLREWARENGLGELFDENNQVNVELAKQIIDNYGDKLQGQTQATLEELVEIQEQLDEFIKNLREHVSEMYSPLVDNFVDSLWAWFDEGKDALDSFRDYASGTFRDIVSDMMKTLVIENVMKGFEDDIAGYYEEYSKGSMSEQELMGKVADRTSELSKSYEQNLPVLQEALTMVNDTLKEAGIDMKEGSSSSSSESSRGIQSMSQETANELNGRFTALQIAGEDIKNQMISAVAILSNISLSSSERNTLLKSILEQHVISNNFLEDLTAYSKAIAGFGEKLDNIVENTQNI